MVNKVYFSALAIGLLTLAGGTNVQAFELLDRMTLGGCGCEPVCSADPCCAPKACRVKMLKGKLHSMFHKNDCCEVVCEEPSCGVEPTCGVEEPSCGIEEPSCGCDPCGKRCNILKGKLRGLMSRCKASCCEVVEEPTCGVEPTCGA